MFRLGLVLSLCCLYDRTSRFWNLTLKARLELSMSGKWLHFGFGAKGLRWQIGRWTLP